MHGSVSGELPYSHFVGKYPVHKVSFDIRCSGLGCYDDRIKEEVSVICLHRLRQMRM